MNPMMSLLLMMATAALAAVAIGAAIFWFMRYSNPEPSLLQQRLIKMKENQSSEAVAVELEKAKKLAHLFKDAEYNNEELGKQLEHLQFFRTLKMRLQQAGIKTPADKYFIMNLLFPTILISILGLVSGLWFLALLGPLVGFGSYAYVLFTRKKRYHKFLTQLPDALGMMTSALRAGHSFQSALTVVSSEMPEPSATEFAAMVRDVNLGIPVKEALARMVAKLETLPDVRMFSTAVVIQREAGGNLAEVLEKLGYTIRERFKLKAQISALTGQSRLTGYVLGGAPAMILTFLTVFMYSYVKPLYETDMGHLALGAVVILQCIGFFVMKKIIDIRV